MNRWTGACDNEFTLEHFTGGHLIIVFDSSPSLNENKHVVQLCPNLVELIHFKKVWFPFLEVGHTKCC